jgi:hypothetical protein
LLGLLAARQFLTALPFPITDLLEQSLGLLA